MLDRRNGLALTRRQWLRQTAIRAGAAALGATLPQARRAFKPDVAALNPTLEPIRQKYDLPALGAAVVKDGKLAARGVTGVRKYGTDVKAAAGDPFHLGSCTKAMTATLCGMLVEQGKLRWNTTLGEAFPELADRMPAVVRAVTVDHLLAHRSGFSNDSWPKGKTIDEMRHLPGTPREQRAAYATLILQEAPVNNLEFLYSNRNYAIAGVMVERAVDTPWEEVMTQSLFKPLKMEAAGFGAMGTPGKIDAPWQHLLSGAQHLPIAPGLMSDNPPVIAPAGRVHCSVADWAQFVAIHIKGARGESALLKPETYLHLHTPLFGGNYMAGWIVTDRDWAGGQVFTHGGSNRMNYAVVWMAPKRDFGVVVVTNQGEGKTGDACDETATALIGQFVTD